jgi:hypothetical protein
LELIHLFVETLDNYFGSGKLCFDLVESSFFAEISCTGSFEPGYPLYQNLTVQSFLSVRTGFGV